MREVYYDRRTSSYTTWYDFRKDLGKSLGYIPLNWLWLKVKPDCPLPWSKSQMRTALSAVARIKGQKGVVGGK